LSVCVTDCAAAAPVKTKPTAKHAKKRLMLAAAITTKPNWPRRQRVLEVVFVNVMEIPHQKFVVKKSTEPLQDELK
jgi:hypothetical protein